MRYANYWIDVRIGWINEWLGQWIDEQTDGKENGWMQWIIRQKACNGYLYSLEVLCQFV